MPGTQMFAGRLSRKGFFSLCVVIVVAVAIAATLLRRTSNPTSADRAAPTASALEVAVQIALPEHHEITREVVLAGSIEAFEQAPLYSKTAGYLKWIKVDIGDSVRKGDVLAEIDVPEMLPEYKGAEAEVERARVNVENAQAELQRAKAELELKKVTYERFKSIRDQEPDVMAEQQVDEAKAQFEVARAVVSVAESRIKVHKSEVAKAEAVRDRLTELMEYTKIRAPFTGVVIKRHVDPGALIQHASSQTNVSPVVTIGRVDTLRIFADVAEPEVPLVKRGNHVALTVNALPDRIFEGTITRFAGGLDSKTRTLRTQIDIPNREGLLRPGMYAAVRLSLGNKQDALTVPASALIIEGDKSYVYTVADGKARRVEVQCGADDGIRVEVTGGLTGAEPVITTGKNAVKDGSPVKVSQTSSGPTSYEGERSGSSSQASRVGPDRVATSHRGGAENAEAAQKGVFSALSVRSPRLCGGCFSRGNTVTEAIMKEES